MNSSSAAAAPVILFQTKLYLPQVDHNYIERPQLIDHLNRGLDRKLTVITAPAGYGKTTVVSQWLASRVSDSVSVRQKEAWSHKHPPLAASVAWLSLDEYDNDLHLFVRYLVAAIQMWRPRDI